MVFLQFKHKGCETKRVGKSHAKFIAWDFPTLLMLILEFKPGFDR
jgi:hypothetical protein